jgi:hypothetical protein
MTAIGGAVSAEQRLDGHAGANLLRLRLKGRRGP